MLFRTVQVGLTAAAALALSTVLVPTARAGRVSPVAPSFAPGSAAPVHLHYVVAPAGNEARYRVREQLVGLDFPNDAVGVTHKITGGFVVDTSGRVVEDSSKLTIDVSVLKSDKDRRDKTVREKLMETGKFPTVDLVPTLIKGVGGLPPASGAKPVEIQSNMTVKGITHPRVWHGTANFAGDDVTGTISTAFTWADIGMKQPSVAIVLSVEDTIKLEYDFHFVKQK